MPQKEGASAGEATEELDMTPGDVWRRTQNGALGAYREDRADALLISSRSTHECRDAKEDAERAEEVDEAIEDVHISGWQDAHAESADESGDRASCSGGTTPAKEPSRPTLRSYSRGRSPCIS